jgi:virginiamycin B lyase
MAMAVTIATALFGVGSARAVTITEFQSNPGTFNALPEKIVAGPGGNLWWTERGGQPSIGRMSTTGERLPPITDSNEPTALVAAPSGWVSWVAVKGFGSVSPTGSITKASSSFKGAAIALTAGNEVRFGGNYGTGVASVCSPLPATSDHLVEGMTCDGEKNGSSVGGMAASTGDLLWVSLPDVDAVKIYSAAALVLQKKVEVPAGSRPTGIAVDPEGDAWVAMWAAGAIDRITPTGTRTRFLLPPGSKPYDLVFGPDGAFWIIEAGTGKIARMTTDGLVTNEYLVPSEETGQSGITVGPDGNIWFTDTEMSLIGKLVPDPLVPPAGPSGGPPPAAAPVTKAPDKVPPHFNGSPVFSPKRFRVAGASKAKSAGAAPVGSVLKFSLSEDASVTATISLKVPGRRAGRNCVAPRKAKAGAKKCTRYLSRGQVAMAAKRGANRFTFSGKVRGRALAVGAYQASLVAKDAAGNPSTVATASFTISL